MRYIAIFLIAVSIISYTAIAWAEHCEYCYEKISRGERFCSECKLKVDKGPSESELRLPSNCELCYEKISAGERFCMECKQKLSGNGSSIRFQEEQLVSELNASRESYRRSLVDLIQYYMDVGDHQRLTNSRKELKALNKVPQYKYIIKVLIAANVMSTENIEAANTLFHNGLVYKNSLNILNKRSNLLFAVSRFEEIMKEYPESDKADDAAYELGSIYESFYFKDYEVAAYYYVKCYELNPNTDKPARYLAGRVYDIYLKDYDNARQNYELALETCRNEKYLKIAESRLVEFNQQ